MVAPPTFKQAPKTNTPPPLKQPVKKKSSSSMYVRIIAGIVLIFIIGGAILKQARVGTLGSSYQENVMSVGEFEQANPARFLDASGTYHENFWGTKMKVDGTIVNNATIANYKDVVVEVTFFSETQTVLDKQRLLSMAFFQHIARRLLN